MKINLNFGYYPKGLLPFHKYKNDIFLQLLKNIYLKQPYMLQHDNKADLHFTISERFKDKFD